MPKHYRIVVTNRFASVYDTAEAAYAELDTFSADAAPGYEVVECEYIERPEPRDYIVVNEFTKSLFAGATTLTDAKRLVRSGLNLMIMKITPYMEDENR